MIDINEYNRRLYRLFRSSDFRTQLIAKVKHTDGIPYLRINEENHSLESGYFVGRFFGDDYAAQASYSCPSDEVEEFCFEFIKQHEPEIYEFIKDIDSIHGSYECLV